MIVGTTPMIAIPVAAFMGPVAMIVGPTPQTRCNDFGPGPPMIAIPAADDCGSLQVPASTIFAAVFRWCRRHCCRNAWRSWSGSVSSSGARWQAHTW